MKVGDLVQASWGEKRIGIIVDDQFGDSIWASFKVWWFGDEFKESDFGWYGASGKFKVILVQKA